MNGYHHSAEPATNSTGDCRNKFAADGVPPITIRRSTPTPEGMQNQRQQQQAAAASRSNGGCMLPQISPHTSILSGGQAPVAGQMGAQSPADTNVQTWGPVGPVAGSGDICLYKHPFQIKEEPSSCAQFRSYASSNGLHPISSSSSSVSAATTGPPEAQHLHIPNGAPHYALSMTNNADYHNRFAGSGKAGQTSKVKLEHPSTRSLFPSLSHSVVSNSDLEEANPSTLNPPLHSYSPYFGSGISDAPSLPSIPNSAHQLSRKRALSSSPLSDLATELSHSGGSFLYQAPNPLLTIINPATAATVTASPLSPGVPSTMSHLAGTSAAPSPTAKGHQFMRIQKRKTSIELNHNIDGSTNTTITNQITFCDHTRTQDNKYREPIVGHNVNGTLAEDDLMESSEYDSKQSRTSPEQPGLVQVKDEPVEPRICMWNGCGQEFGDLDDIVQHIENTHIEKGKMDDFTCMWQSCPRKCKPFNARYKLLIHMRIHSGEKPNKCTVSNQPLNLTQVLPHASKVHCVLHKLCGLLVI